MPPRANSKIANSEDVKSAEVFLVSCQQTLADLTFDCSSQPKSSFYSQQNRSFLKILTFRLPGYRTWLTVLSSPAPPAPHSSLSLWSEIWSRGRGIKQTRALSLGSSLVLVVHRPGKYIRLTNGIGLQWWIISWWEHINHLGLIDCLFVIRCVIVSRFNTS